MVSGSEVMGCGALDCEWFSKAVAEWGGNGERPAEEGGWIRMWRGHSASFCTVELAHPCPGTGIECVRR